MTNRRMYVCGRAKHPIHKYCEHQHCWCNKWATHKVRESNVPKGGHAPFGFLCCEHFGLMMGRQEACGVAEKKAEARIDDGKRCFFFWHAWGEWRDAGSRGWYKRRDCLRCGVIQEKEV